MRSKAPAELPTALRDLGLRVAELRAERHLTQANLAEAVGVSLRYLQAVEGGKQNLKVLTLERFALALDVGMLELFRRPTIRPRGPGRPRKAE